MSETLQSLEQLAKQLDAVHQQIKHTLEHGYPIGSKVAWNHHGHPQVGTVVMHGATYQGSAQLRVKNQHTGKTVWIRYSKCDMGFCS